MNAFSTQVTFPPFLNQFPLADEMTTGFTPPGATAGARPKRPTGAAAATPAAAPVRTKSRREIFRLMPTPFGYRFESAEVYPLRCGRRASRCYPHRGGLPGPHARSEG